MTTRARTIIPRRGRSGLAADLTDLIRGLTLMLFDSYRPERHYMRGPGPKCRARWQTADHARRPAFDPVKVPAVARVRRRG